VSGPWETDVSLALATLIFEWRRYSAAVIALAFSGLLLLAITGIVLGIGQSATATVDRSAADLIVLDAHSESMLQTGGLPRRIKPAVYLNPEVLTVDEMTGFGAQFRNQPPVGQKKKSTFVQIMGVDPYPGSGNMPTDFTEATRVALLQPYTVAVDRTALAQLGVKLGDLATLNGRTVKVATLLDGYASINQALVITSRDTLRLISNTPSGPNTGPLMIKLRDPAKAELIRNQLNAVSGGKYRAWTKPELSKADQSALMKEQTVGVLVGFIGILSVFIGIGITSQTLRGAILANIKEFASLRALGVSMGSLRVIVVELSFWVGVTGIGLAGLMTFAVGRLAAMGAVPMSFPFWLLGSVSVMLLFIALMSGLMSLGMLKKSQPADLLR
jgi:putative ABC transport system permease protein